MRELKNKFYGRNDGDMIDDYLYGECYKPEVAQMTWDTVALECVPFQRCREKVTVRIEDFNFDREVRAFSILVFAFYFLRSGGL